MKAPFLVFDETDAHLDNENTKKMMEIIRKG